jgi:hypothetical protein
LLVIGIIRFFIVILVCFLSPALAYLFYRKLQSIIKSEQKISIKTPSEKEPKFPQKQILIIGTILSILTMLYLATLDRNPPNSTYVPARFEDGKLIPHKIIPKKDGE